MGEKIEIFAAVGASGAVRWSDDGKTWTDSGTAGSTALWSVAWSPELELFAAVGDDGAVRWSDDGKTWTDSGTAGSSALYGVAWSSPNYSIKGTVKLGVTLKENVTVRLIDQETSEIMDITTTDSNGVYQFNSLNPDKEYHVGFVEFEENGTKYTARTLYDIKPK